MGAGRPDPRTPEERKEQEKEAARTWRNERCNAWLRLLDDEHDDREAARYYGKQGGGQLI